MSNQAQASQSRAVAAPAQARKDIRDVIQSQRGEIEKALPRHMNADRMIRVMLTALNTTPKLIDCTRESLLSALMKCSQYGLEPDGRHAHLIPYKDQCQLIFDYKGLVNLVRRSGDVTDIHCDVVYEKDEFEFSFGTDSTLRHRPNLRDRDRGEVTCAYSFVKLKDGSVSYEVMPWWEIEAVKENSQGFKAFKAGYTKSNPWDTNWNEMAKKTVFRRHTKWLPLSFELAEAITSDDDKQSEEARFAAAKPAVVANSTNFLPEPQPQDAALSHDQPAREPEPVSAASEPAPEAKAPETKPERAKKSGEKTAEPAPDIHRQLQAFLGENEIALDHFMIWAKENGHIQPEANTLSEIPELRVKILIGDAPRKAKTLEALKGWVAQ